MKLSENIIIESLSQYGAVSMLPGNRHFRFSSVRLLSHGAAEFRADTLYVGKSCNLRKLKCSQLKTVCIVCVGKMEFFTKFLLKHPANLICLPEECELSEVINRLFSLFTRLNRWQHDLIVAEISNRGFQTLIDLAKEVFGENPILISDASYNIVAASLKGTPCNPTVNDVLQKGYYDKDMMDQFNRMGYIRNEKNYHTPTLVFPPTYMKCPFALRTFQCDEMLYSFVAVYFVREAPSKTEFELFCLFSEWLEKYLRRQHNLSVVRIKTPMEMFLRDLLSGTQKDERYIVDRARFLKLPTDADIKVPWCFCCTQTALPRKSPMISMTTLPR